MTAKPSDATDANAARPVVWLPPRRFDAPPTSAFPEGEYPGQEAVFTLPTTQVEMTVCWCPPGKGLQGFWIAKHPVSQRQWSAVMGNNPSQAGQGDGFPVDSVSWDDAQTFCTKTGLRLPSEKEWEHACRAGTTGDFAIGDGKAIHSQYANFNGDYPHGTGVGVFRWLHRERTVPEGSFPPNAWGLHDMHGQLWEWCEDKVGWGRALRGGCWGSLGWGAASGHRHGSVAGNRNDNFGFRPCPRSILQETKERVRK